MLPVLLLMVVGTPGDSAEPGKGKEALEENLFVVAEIRSLKGEVVFDTKSPGKPVVSISVSHTRVTDALLGRLKRLTSLQSLSLDYAQITDAGLEHLKGLTNLRELSLGNQITGAGLEHLHGLTKLRQLMLQGTRVTDDGVKHLRTKLPKGKIYVTSG